MEVTNHTGIFDAGATRGKITRFIYRHCNRAITGKPAQELPRPQGGLCYEMDIWGCRLRLLHRVTPAKPAGMFDAKMKGRAGLTLPYAVNFGECQIV